MDFIARQGTAVDELLPADMFWRLSLAQYQQMVETGFLTEADPVEFLQGWLVQKIPKTPRHSTVTRLIRLMLEQLVPNG